MTTIDISFLARVAGGRSLSSQERTERYKNLCTGPNARAHYDTMLTQMTPDSSEAPGIKRRVVKSISQVCGWPFPAQ
jgi:hypothetical protein